MKDTVYIQLHLCLKEGVSLPLRGKEGGFSIHIHGQTQSILSTSRHYADHIIIKFLDLPPDLLMGFSWAKQTVMYFFDI